MIRLLFLIVTTNVFTILSYGQVLETKLQKQVDILKLSNVDTFLTYSISCNGRLIPIDTCASEETEYLIWVKNLETFLERFDYCRNYKPIQLDKTNPLTYYLKNKRIIDKEEIKPPTYYEVRKTKKGLDTLTNSVMVDHSCYHRFNLVVKHELIEKNVSIFNLDFVKFDNGRKNIYRNYNQMTKLKKLILQISDIIKKSDTGKNFEAQ